MDHAEELLSFKMDDVAEFLRVAYQLQEIVALGTCLFLSYLPHSTLSLHSHNH